MNDDIRVGDLLFKPNSADILGAQLLDEGWMPLSIIQRNLGKISRHVFPESCVSCFKATPVLGVKDDFYFTPVAHYWVRSPSRLSLETYSKIAKTLLPIDNESSMNGGLSILFRVSAEEAERLAVLVALSSKSDVT